MSVVARSLPAAHACEHLLAARSLTPSAVQQSISDTHGLCRRIVHLHHSDTNARAKPYRHPKRHRLRAATYHDGNVRKSASGVPRPKCCEGCVVMNRHTTQRLDDVARSRPRGRRDGVGTDSGIPLPSPRGSSMALVIRLYRSSWFRTPIPACCSPISAISSPNLSSATRPAAPAGRERSEGTARGR
jgi:hypothetical protein